MAKRAHLKDYRLNDEGSYEYAGLRWTWSEGCDREALLKRAWILFAAAAGCALAAGFVPAPGTFGAFYMVVPYALLAVALVLSGVALGRLTREGTVLRDHVYQASVPALGAKLLLGAVCAAICGAGALVHLALADAGQPAFSILFALLMAAAAALLFFARSAADEWDFDLMR